MLQPPFSKFDKIVLTIGIDAFLVYLVFGLTILGIADRARLGSALYMVQFHFFLFSFGIAWLVAIPFIGKLKTGNKINIPRVILYVLVVKMAIISLFEFIDYTFKSEFSISGGNFQPFFPGYFDFAFMRTYALNYLNGNPTIIYNGLEWVDAYYPPGVAFIYLFLTALNPFQSGLMYRFYMLWFEAGTCYFIYKIACIPKLGIPESIRNKGVIYCFFTITYLAISDFFAKYDTFIIFLTMVGMYYYFKGNLYISSILWTFCALAKLYTIVWIMGVLVYHYKKSIEWDKTAHVSIFRRLLMIRDKTQFFTMMRYVLTCIITGTVILAVAWFFEGFKFFDVLFAFKYQLHDTYGMHVINIWFFLQYTGIPGINIIPYALLFLTALYITGKWKGELTPEYFIRLTAITLLFYPAVNSFYIHWLMPMVCIDMLGSIKKVKILAVIEICAVYFEQTMNLYAVVNGIPLPIILAPGEVPALGFLLLRLANLGLFFVVLIALIFPEKFDRYFPREFNEKKIVMETAPTK